ncbi:hypothetical protein STTU_5004 [Streptomyces sp. Tu6071]|nr:hypothetical protein STTU_5004 [Streptomyces sp. Tu6071]
MRGVDEAERAVLGGFGGRVVAQIGGEEGVGARGPYGVEEAVARSAAHDDLADRRLGVAREADALRGRGQGARGGFREGAEGQRAGGLADTAEAAAALGVAGVGHERAEDAQAERAREGVADAGVGAVGVGVRDVQGDVVLDEVVHDAALEGRRRDGGGAAQVERVVRDEEVGAEADRLLGDLVDGVHGEQHAPDLGPGITDDGPDGVPGLGAVRGPEGVEGGGDFGEAGHGGKVTGSGRGSSGAVRGAGRRPGAEHKVSRMSGDSPVRHPLG